MIGTILSYLVIGFLSFISGVILMCIVQYRRYNEIEALQNDLQKELEKIRVNE